MANLGQDDGYVELCDAIRQNDRVRAQNLIRKNVSVNNSRLKSNTPLHWAVLQFKDLDIMKMLLDRGADVHAKNPHKLKPLDLAIQNGRTEAAILFMKKGALVGADLNKLLLKAIDASDHIIVKSIIDYGIQCNTSINFNTLFNTAVSRGYSKILEHILPHCRFLEASDKYIPRELVIRTRQKYKECVELLLGRNFTIKPNSNRDKYFVYRAVENGHFQIVLQLLKLGIGVNLVNLGTGLNLLKIACINKHREIVETLLEHNASVNETTPTNTELLKNPAYNYYNRRGYNPPLLSIYNKSDLRGLTCLHIAVLNSDPIMTRLLLRYGAKIIDDPTYFNITCIAVRNNCAEIVRIFLDHGVDVNDVDPQGKTLLHLCINTNTNGQDSRYNIVKLLLEKGAIIPIQTPGNSLTFEAIINGCHEIAQLFLDYNANIQYISPDGDTPLHKAIEKDFDAGFIKTLLKLNAPVNAVNNDMFTPLHIVCKLKRNSTTNVITLLLEHNANIEAVDAKGWTPLFHACETGNNVAVKCLLNHHGNVNHKDWEDLTPLYVAAQNSRYNSEVVKILLEHKCNVHCIDKYGNSILHVTVENGNAELIECFARTQVNFNSVNKEGDTPLHIAVKNKSINMTGALIKYGANINILDNTNETPLQKATNYLLYCEKQLKKWHNYHLSLQSRGSRWSNFVDSVWDIETYEHSSYDRKEIIKILKVQVVKLKVAGLKVNNQDLNIVYNSNHSEYFDFSDDENKYYRINVLQLEVKCEHEIKKMKSESIGVNNMTFYDLLQKNNYSLSRFVKNKKIQQALDLNDEKFPLYIDIVKSRIRDAKFRCKLMNFVKNYFSTYVYPRLSDYCIDAVFSYLNIKDISIFISAMKRLDG